MRFCQHHWTKLRTAIEARGLMPLVARNGQEAIEAAVAELKGEASKASFDPLMTAHWMIVHAVTQRVGLALMVGDLCPVCEGIKTNDSVVDPKIGRVYTPEEEESYWINGPADAVLAQVNGDPELSALLTAVSGNSGGDV